MQTPRVPPTPEPSAAPARRRPASDRGVLLAVALLALGGCVTPRLTPTFSAYWYTSSDIAPCPVGEHCVAYTESLETFEALRQEQRDNQLELVDFDARISDDYAIYAGLWRPSALHHDLSVGLDWGGFVSEQQKRASAGEGLVSFTVYDDRGEQRVAAIWSTKSQEGPTHDIVRHIVGWNELEKTIKNATGPDLYLAQIEVYDHPGNPSGTSSGQVKSPWLAGVWRAGNVETHILRGLACDGNAVVTAATTSGDSVDVAPSSLFSRCELMTKLYAMHDNGFRAVDFERYMEAGVEHWAVLLQRRHERDWLMFPGRLEDITYRDTRLKTAQTGTPFVLFDLDILSVALTSSRPHQYHEGVVHDGSTSGPPP